MKFQGKNLKLVDFVKVVKIPHLEKIKMKSITMILGSAGIMMILASIIRWSIVYYDLSQLVLASIVGTIFLGFAFFYERLTGIYEELKKIQDMREQIKKEVIEEVAS